MTGTLAAVAPAAPAAGYAVLGIGLLCSFVVAWGLQSAWRATFGPLLAWLGNLGIKAGRGIFKIDIHPFRFALKANTAIERWLSQTVALSERGMVWAFGHALQLLLLIVHTTEQLARDTYHWAARTSHVTRTTVTRTIRETVVKPTTRLVKYADAKLTARVNSLTARVTALAAHVAHIAAPIPRAIPQVIPRLGRLERTAVDYVKLHRWLKRAMLGTLGAAAVATALKTLRLSWVRCTNTRRLGKRACTMDSSLLEAVLADTLLVVGTLSLIEFAREMDSVTSEVAPLVGKFWRAV